MAVLRLIIYGLVETTQVELQKELLLLDINKEGETIDRATQLPVINWDNLVNNPVEIRTGWNFFQDKRNTFRGVDGKEWLATRVGNKR